MSNPNIFPFKPHLPSLRGISEHEALFWLREGDSFFQAFQLHLDGQHYYKAVFALHQATACYYTALVLERLDEKKQAVEQLLALLRKLTAEPSEECCAEAFTALTQCVALFRDFTLNSLARLPRSRRRP